MRKPAVRNMIGIFDSGLGGLTALKEIHRLTPGEELIYFGDTGRVPYGTKSADIITKYALQDASFLMSKGVDAILVAWRNGQYYRPFRIEKYFFRPDNRSGRAGCQGGCQGNR